LDGKTIATFSKAYPTARPQPGHVEQNPEDWMDRVLAALRTFATEPHVAVVGIVFCSQVNTHVFVDDAGEPVMPAIVWQDTRCGDAAAALDPHVTPDGDKRVFDE